MKKLFISIISILSCLSAFSYDFFQTFGEYEWDMRTLYFDWVVPGETCQTAAVTDIELVCDPAEYDPNQYIWTLVSPGKESWEIKGANSLSYGAVQIPSTFVYTGPEEEYNGKTITVVGIGDFSFLYGDVPANLVIPETVEYIGKGAFYGWNQDCERLDLPNVKRIDDCAFTLCKIKELNLPSCTSLGNYAFFQNDQLKKLTLNDNIDRIGEYAFYKAGIEELDLPRCKEIGDYAFYNAGSLMNLTLESVDRIGEYAFAECMDISSLDLKYCREICNHAFFNDKSIETITIGEVVEPIGEYAFYECEDLKSLTIEKCPEIGDYAFYNVSNLTHLSLSDNLTRIGNYAFYSCSTLPELTIPDATEFIGDYAFYNCPALCPLILGKNVRWIGDYAFYLARFNQDCGVSDFYLPGTLEHVGAMAFCFNNTATDSRPKGKEYGVLTDIYIPREEPPATAFTEEEGYGPFGIFDREMYESGGFYNQHELWMYPYICLHVPAGSLEAYRNAPGWKDFLCIIDDMVDVGASSVEDIENIGYAFMVPGESLDLQTDIFAGDVFKMAGRESDFHWEIQDNLTDEGELIAELDNGSMVTAGHFGQALAVLYRNDGNQTFNGSSYDDVEPTIAGCVIIFVCPTITVVYNNDNSENAALSSRRSKLTDDTTSDESTSDESSVEALIDPYISYEHRVVYNSLPKLTIESSPRVHIDGMERGESNEDNIFVEQMAEFDDKQFTDDGRIVPLDPITNNRIIELFLTDEGTLSSVETIKLSDNVSLKVAGRTVSVVGAADTDTVKVFDTAGRTVYNSTVKTFAINGTGVFVVTVANTAFKILVK